MKRLADGKGSLARGGLEEARAQIQGVPFNPEGSAPCGPACGVLWEPGEKSPRQLDYAFSSAGPTQNNGL